MKAGICPRCGGKTADRSVDVLESIGGKLVILRGISAEVCVRCGQRLYSGEEMRKMEKLRERIEHNLVKPVSVEEVEVFAV